MPNAIPTNTDLSTTFWVPIVAIQIQLGSTGSNALGYLRRVLLLGHKNSTAPMLLNTPYKVQQQGDVNQLAGATSELGAAYAHFQAQVAAQSGSGADVYIITVPEPVGGTKATHLITLGNAIDPTTGLPYVDPVTTMASVKAQASGFVDVYVDAWKFTVGVSQGDTFAVIAGNIVTEITNRITSLTAPWNAPITGATNGGTATVTVTANHAGLIGNDLPIKVNFSSAAMRLSASPGTVTFATNAGGAGTVSLVANSQTVQAAIANTNTPSQASAALATAINAGAYDVGAFDNSAVTPGQCILYYQTDRVAYRLSVSASGIAPQTATAAVGAAGAGAPSLSAALLALRSAPQMRLWVNPWVDSASVGSIYNEIEFQANGINQRGQVVMMSSTDSQTNAAAIITTPTPALTTSPRYILGWCPDDEIRGVDTAARMAAMVVSSDQPNDNWNGSPFLTVGVTPLGAPALAVRPDPGTTCNTALYNQHMSPIVVNENGQKVLLRGITTVVAADDSLANWGVIFGLDFARAFARAFLTGRFFQPPPQSRLVKRVGKPQSPKSITAAVVADAIGEILDCLEQGCSATNLTPACPPDIVDGADQLRRMIQFQSNPQVSGRIDVTFPTRITPPLISIGVVEQQGA